MAEIRSMAEGSTRPTSSVYLKAVKPRAGVMLLLRAYLALPNLLP